MATVGSHQQATFTIPVNGTSPVDADEVRLNYNAMAVSYNGHDNDATLHVQSSTLALRPSAGAAGRYWFTTDERRFYYDTGSLWQDLTVDAGDVTSGVLGVARGGIGVGSAPANGQVLIGDGTGYVLATITPGNNITVTNTPGGIQLDVTGLASGVSGSGTGGTVPRLVGTGTVSQIGTGSIQDDGTRVGIGQAPDATYRTTTDSLRVSGGSESHNGVPYTMPAAQGAASSVLTNNGSGGLSWAIPTQPLDQQVFNSSGTWSKPSQGSMVFVEVWGAGGSGSNSNTAGDRNGGAGGGYVSRLIRVADLAATETVTIGAGGASRTIAANGIAGGDSSFGTHVTAYGGAGGQLVSGSTAVAFGGSTMRAGQAVAGVGGVDTFSPLYWDYYDRTFNGGIALCAFERAGSVLSNSLWGGAAGATSGNGSGSLLAAGTSVYGGNGGATATDGIAPGGGGGRGDNTGGGRSGAGASGRVRITVW